MKFATWLAASPLGSWAKSFVAFLLAAAVGDWATGGQISLANWQTWVISGLAATIPPVIAWLNPADTRYGKGAE